MSESVGSASGRPHLADNVIVQSGLDVDDLWDRFEIFEALHHTLPIATPMSSGDLDRVVELLEPSAGNHVLDLACGRGELLRRMRGRASIDGVGVDLSPWMVAGAAQGGGDLQWLLADAAALLPAGDSDAPAITDPAARLMSAQPWDVVCCLGASWIWYGLRGTIRAAAGMVRPGGLVAIGDMHIRPGLDPESVLQTHGRVDSLDDFDHWFVDNGIDIVDRVTTSDDSWAAYHDRVNQAAATWVDAALNPERAQHWVDEARQWRADAERDRTVLTWSVWVGRKRDD